MKILLSTSILILALVLNAAEKPTVSSNASINEKLTADIQPKNGSQVSGQVEFLQTAKGVLIKYKIQNLPANKSFGMHIHEKPDCSSVDGKSAGGHYAKMSSYEGHGTSLDFPDLYAGDLPSIKSNKNGIAEGQLTTEHLSISQTSSGTHSLTDRSIIVHAAPDDIKKKSAPRIGCGVLKSNLK